MLALSDRGASTTAKHPHHADSGDSKTPKQSSTEACRPCSLRSLDARTSTQPAEAYATKEKRTGCESVRQSF